jgi:membrane fusion protein, multidrug efflux system
VEDVREMGQQTPGEARDDARAEQASSPRPRRRPIRRVLIAGALIVCAVLGYFLIRRYVIRRAAPQASRIMQPGGVPVTTATAKRGNIGVYLEAIGTVTPLCTASITAQVNGLIVGVHYAEGQIVHRGDPLIDIDPRPFEAQVLQAQGTLDRDMNVLAQARMDLARYRDAWSRNAIPRQQLEDQEKIVLQNEGQVRSDQGNLQFLKVQLGWAHIVAPFTGRVGLRLVDPGNVVVLTPGNQSGTVNATTSLVVITQIEPITVVFTLAEDSLSEVRAQVRQGAVLRVDAFDRSMLTKIASGILTAIDNQIDTTTGTVKLRATFQNSDDALFPNQFVNARLLVKTLRGVILLPSQAVQHNGQIAFVYVIRDGVAHIQNVKTGITDAGMTVIEGIRPGDVVATDNFEKLQDGAPVTPNKKPAAGAAGHPKQP